MAETEHKMAKCEKELNSLEHLSLLVGIFLGAATIIIGFFFGYMQIDNSREFTKSETELTIKLNNIENEINILKQNIKMMKDAENKKQIEQEEEIKVKK